MCELRVPVEEYWPKLVDMCYFKVYCIGHVKDSKQTFIHEDKFSLSKAQIQIKVRKLIYLFIHSFIHFFIHLFILSFMYLFSYLSICLFYHLCVYCTTM